MHRLMTLLLTLMSLTWALQAIQGQEPTPQPFPPLPPSSPIQPEPPSPTLPPMPSIQPTGNESSSVSTFVPVSDPEATTGLLAEMLQQDKPKAADDKPKEKKWFEKMNLRGYTQFRLNPTIVHDKDLAEPQHVGDRSIGVNQNFLIRRARLILFGDISDHLYLYIQPDFASTPSGSRDATFFAQLRDLYGDVFIDTTKEHRFRVGLSKVPYGWENLQSSQNRLPLDRNDAFNSATKNERDLGVFYYWTPQEAQRIFKYVMDENLKGSGNYGVFGFGLYNGQGGALQEQNENVHVISRLTLPYQFDNGQIVEAGVQAFTGKYVVFGSPIRPLGQGTRDITPAGTFERGDRAGIREDRIGGTFILYPQPIGFQAEWTVGRGPGLNEDQNEVIERSLHGGYLLANVKIDTCQHGIFFPFVRWSYFVGGYRSERNAPYSHIDEWEMGLEWQIRKEMELVVSYLVTDRTNTTAISSSAAVSEASYEQFVGQVLRIQFQLNY